MMPKAIPEFNERQVANFWRHVEKTDGCWNWIGATNGRGYGVLRIRSAGVFKPHRVAWMLAGRELDLTMTLDHKCLNMLCVNPDHLEQVTMSENAKRSYSRHPERYSTLTVEEKKQRNRENQARWVAKHPEQAKANYRKYYELGGGKEKRAAKWKEFQASYKALEPPDDEDHGYAS